MSYLDEFVESIRFLEKFDKNHKKLNLDYDDIKKGISENLKHNDELNSFLSSKLDDIANQFISNSTVSLINSCHNTSQQFYDNWMSQNIGELAPVAITVGDVYINDIPIYNVSKSSIKKTLAIGFDSNSSLDLHVWLTFPNMKVLDLTIVPTLIHRGIATEEDFDNKKYVIWEDNNNRKIRYKPFLQHNGFMYVVDRIAGHV